MTDEQFCALVGRLEGEARANPGAYRFRVLMLALFGNVYCGVILTIVLALFLVLVASIAFLKLIALKLIVPVGFFLWMIVKALWIKMEAPSGTELDAAQAPELFATIDELRRQLGAPQFHHVLITDDFNAGVVQSPRLGLFGWYRNHLLIGLPLMKSLSVEQFKAVLAHELGHLARSHGRVSNWVYCQRLRWSRLMALLEAHESAGSFLFKPFLNRFAPYFNAYSFPLARANEYEADATSARLTSPRAAAEALTRVSVVGGYLAERYWPRIHRMANEQPQPGFAPYSNMGHHVATELDDDSAKGWLERAMARQTSSADTHPALADRLAAIGETPRLAPPVAGESADRLLGGARDSIAAALDRRWQADIRPAWERRHREVQEGRRRLAELNIRSDSGAQLTPQDAYDRAWLTESIGGDAASALAQFRSLHDRHPESSVACYALGARLLARDDPAGCELVQRAMQLDEFSICGGAELLRDYHWRNGREEEAHAWHKRLIEREATERAAENERVSVRLTDKLDRHGLSEAELERLRAQLREIAGLGKVYFVRKRVEYLEHRHLYVLGFKLTGRLMSLRGKERAKEVLRQIQQNVAFPGETLILNVERDNYRFGRKLAWVRGARIL